MKVTGDIESMSFNTAISALMVLTNHLLTLKEVPLEAAESFTLMVSLLLIWVRSAGAGNSDTLAYHPADFADERALCRFHDHDGSPGQRQDPWNHCAVDTDQETADSWRKPLIVSNTAGRKEIRLFMCRDESSTL
jgi:hypothetical protein